MKNWVDISTIDNNTPFYDVAWSFSAHTDGEISFGDRWFSEIPGLVTDDAGWGGMEGRKEKHRFNCSFGNHSSNFYTCNFNDIYNDVNCGYTISVTDETIGHLPNVEIISGIPCNCLGLREWVDWKPLYGAYSGMSTMFEPGNIFVQLASSGVTNKNIADIRIGNEFTQKVYLGNDVVWLPEYYVEEDNGTTHRLCPAPWNNNLYANFDMDHDGTFTLYHNGTVVTANTCHWLVMGKCNEKTWYEEGPRTDTDVVVENICGTCQYPTSTGKKNVYVGVTPDYLTIETYYDYCSGSTSGHTASVLLDGSVDIDLPETLGGMYEMAFSEPYTSITLYYDDEVVTASTLFVSVDGMREASENDFEVADINTDTYGGTSINTISFNADSNDVYIDFTP